MLQLPNPLPNTMLAGFSGNVTFSGLRPGLYVLKIHAYNRRDDARTVKRGFVVTSDPDYCSLVLVNEGVRVSENGREAVVKVKGHGPAEDSHVYWIVESSLAVSIMHAHSLGV